MNRTVLVRCACVVRKGLTIHCGSWGLSCCLLSRAGGNRIRVPNFRSIAPSHLQFFSGRFFTCSFGSSPKTKMINAIMLIRSTMLFIMTSTHAGCRSVQCITWQFSFKFNSHWVGLFASIFRMAVLVVLVLFLVGFVLFCIWKIPGFLLSPILQYVGIANQRQTF